MGIYNTYYRAWKAYLEALQKDKTIHNINNAAGMASADSDTLEVIRHSCTISEDWVTAIEAGLVYLEKAVHAERQFITQNGEVVRIEKVKHVSPASVAHLAKHSNLITHLPENPDDNLIPDQLFVEEKLSDYAVYENKFLYLLLITLQEFIDSRLKKIRESAKTCLVDMRVRREFRVGKRHVYYKLHFSDENMDDPLTSFGDDMLAIFTKIEDLQSMVGALLQTPLMQYLSKVPMIHPPITKTNVLKMNVDFKKCLELYDYISSYKQPGYEITEIQEHMAPLPGQMPEQYVPLTGTNLFLAYAYGNHLEKELESQWQQEEEEAAAKSIQDLKDRLEEVRARARRGEMSLEEYCALLEDNLKVAQDENKDTQQKFSAMENQVFALQKDVTHLGNQIESLQETIAGKETQNAQLNEEINRQKKNFQDSLSDLQSKMQEKQAQYKTLEDDYRDIYQQWVTDEAELKGVRKTYVPGYNEGDWSERERAHELEKEYKAFQELYKKQWKKTQARIRKDILGFGDKPQSESGVNDP